MREPFFIDDIENDIYKVHLQNDSFLVTMWVKYDVGSIIVVSIWNWPAIAINSVEKGIVKDLNFIIRMQEFAFNLCG